MADLVGVCGAYDLERATAALELIKGSNRGYLAVSDGRRDVCFLFAQGGLRLGARGLVLPQLGDWLQFQGELSPAEFQRLRKQRTQVSDEREALLAAGVPETRVDKGARSLMGRLVLDALLWDQPACDAGAGEAPFKDNLYDDDVTTMVGSGLQPLVEGLLGLLQDVAPTLAQLPTADVSVVTTGEKKARERLEGAQGSLEARLLEAVLAKPGIHAAELLELLGCGEMALVSMLAALSRLEVLEAAPLPRDAEARRQEAERLLGRPLVELPRRLWLAEAARAAEDSQAACRHEARAGWLLVDMGRHREALEHFGEALKLAPGDLEALQGRVQVLWQLDRGEEAARDTAELAPRLIQAGLATHALRALEQANKVRERADLEVLQVEALLALGERRAAQDQGAYLLNKLESKGGGPQARRARQLLEECGAGAEAPSYTPGPRGPSGALRATALASCGLAVLLAGGSWLSWNDLLERKAYAANVELARGWLEDQVDLAKLDSLFPAQNVGASAAGEMTSQVRSELELLRKDEEAVIRLRELVGIAWDQDIQQVIRILDGTQAQTSALRQPVRELRERANRHLEAALQIQRRLKPLRSDRRLEQAFSLGRELLDDYKNVPSVIEDRSTRVPVEIVSEPSGAIVRWQGHRVGATPMTVEVPLVGSCDLVLERQDYQTVERQVCFGELEAPRVVVRLERSEQ